MGIEENNSSEIHMPDAVERFYSAKGAAKACIEQTLADAKLVRIATAYFEISGYQVLQDILAGKRIHLLVGREEGGRDNVTDVINEFESELSCGDMERRTRAARLLLEALQQGMITVGVGADAFEQVAVMDPRYLYHHAKLYIADECAAVVGSANFSAHGLVTSREAGIRITSLEDVQFFVRRFDEYFARAAFITRDLIKKLMDWLRAYDPFLIYARALLELYGLPEENTPESLPLLAPYQRAVVSSVLASLLNQRGAFLIASTGLGKTIIAAHTVAYLRMQNEVDCVIVACPAGLKEMWRRTMRAARTASEAFSYNTLSGNDRKRDAQIGTLEYELRHVNERTLIILDESHHLRNEEGDAGEIRLRNRRIYSAIHEKKARILLMTATPYSRDQQDVNNQLKLLPEPQSPGQTLLGFSVQSKHWEIDQLKQLSDMPPCTVLTTPDVVQHFGRQDEKNERYVEFAPDTRRYFPRRIQLRTIRYENPLDDLLVELLTSTLLYKKRDANAPDDSQPELFPDEILDDLLTGDGRRDPLFETQVLHQFCSSTARVKILCDQMVNNSFEFKFERPERLKEFIQSHSTLIERASRPKNDTKLQCLAEIIEHSEGKKVTIFCHYLETARRLKEGLEKHFPQIKLETTAEKHGSDLDRILQRFAPVANEVPLEDRNPSDELKVLIATGALAEGFNLQDSNILVNYDLPWTVLQLAQRMGRLLRPWHEPREIFIYNFVPSTMEDERLRHARRWKNRLQERGEQHRSFAQIPVLLRQERDDQPDDGYQMVDLARELYVRGNDDLDLDEVLEFIQNSDSLTTSTFYKDLASIPNQAEISKLPAGIRSARMCKGKKRLFVLFRQGRLIQAGLFDAFGVLVKDGDRREIAMQAIRCDPDEPKAPAKLYPEDDAFDLWLNSARRHWAEFQDVPEHKLVIVCAMALIPE